MMRLVLTAIIVVSLVPLAMAQITNGYGPANLGLLGPICPGTGALCLPVPLATPPCGNGTLDFSDACGTTFHLLQVD